MNANLSYLQDMHQARIEEYWHALTDNELQYDILGCKIQNFTKYAINCTIE